jgi:hypothetical protein
VQNEPHCVSQAAYTDSELKFLLVWFLRSITTACFT